MSRVRFGRFEFDARTGELLRDGTPRALQPQPARMLAALVARPGDLVTREELRSALWGTDTHVDYEKGLAYCAAQVRAALGDSASSPHYIETVPRRGYRFVGTMAGDVPVGARPSRTGAEPRWLLRAIAAAAIGAAGMAGAFVLHARTMPRTPIVAVVPFQNETGIADVDRLAKGLSDTTVARLADPARLTHLRVIGNASDLRFTFKPPDLKRMGESLGAEFIVLGQVKRDDEAYRVVAHLIRVSDQTHVWAATFDRPSLTLAVQSDLGEAIAREVSARVAR